MRESVSGSEGFDPYPPSSPWSERRGEGKAFGEGEV